MRALITGLGGFVGRHLLHHLWANGDHVSGLAREADARDLPDGVELFAVDLLDRKSVDRAISSARPEAVYHLAAQSSSGESLADPWATLSNNLLGQLNLLESVVSWASSARVLAVCSSEEYGRVRPDEIPTHEDVPLRPTSPYAVSKVGQDAMAYQYFAQHKLAIVRVRPFSHTGPGHDPRFAIPSFAKQLAEIEAGRRTPVLRVGNLDAARDYTDVRDMVRAYRLALMLGEPGEVYNLGRGESVRLSAVLEELRALCRAAVSVEEDPARLRPSDVPFQQADTSRFTALTGWKPEIPWRTTLQDTLDYWRGRVGATLAVS